MHVYCKGNEEPKQTVELLDSCMMLCLLNESCMLMIMSFSMQTSFHTLISLAVTGKRYLTMEHGNWLERIIGWGAGGGRAGGTYNFLWGTSINHRFHNRPSSFQQIGLHVHKFVQTSMNTEARS